MEGVGWAPEGSPGYGADVGKHGVIVPQRGRTLTLPSPAAAGEGSRGRRERVLFLGGLGEFDGGQEGAGGAAFFFGFADAGAERAVDGEPGGDEDEDGGCQLHQEGLVHGGG